MKKVLSPISEKKMSRNPETNPSLKGESPTTPGHQNHVGLVSSHGVHSKLCQNPIDEGDEVGLKFYLEY
jgi:hypothetical protein